GRRAGTAHHTVAPVPLGVVGKCRRYRRPRTGRGPRSWPTGHLTGRAGRGLHHGPAATRRPRRRHLVREGGSLGDPQFRYPRSPDVCVGFAPTGGTLDGRLRIVPAIETGVVVDPSRDERQQRRFRPEAQVVDGSVDLALTCAEL